MISISIIKHEFERVAETIQMRFVKQPHRNRIKFSKSKYAKRTIRKLNKILIKVDNNKIEKKKKELSQV